MVECPICMSLKNKIKFVFNSKMLKKVLDVRVCELCGYEWLFPQPTDDELSRIYSVDYYKAWGHDWRADSVKNIKQITFNLRMKLLPPLANENVLDCGCAGGYFFKIAIENGYRPFGVEINSEAVKTANEAFPENEIFQGLLEDSPFAKESFYAVFMSDYIEHVRSPKQAIKKAYDLLKPGGYLLLSTPSVDTLSARLMKRSWLHYKEEHLSYFNRINISKLLMDNGFEIIKIKPAKKCLTPEYIQSIFNAYPRRGLTVLINSLLRLMPAFVKKLKLSFFCGEIVVLGRKSIRQ